MNCQTVRNSLSEFLDRRLSGNMRTRIAMHLDGCSDCAARLRELSHLRQNLRNLPERNIPAQLRAQLQVMASHERARHAATHTPLVALRNWSANLRLVIDNLMRPLALPLTGGLVSALLIFALLVPTFGVRPAVMNDVPTSLYTAATLVEVAPPGISNDDTVVELFVDAKGQATDYSVQRGKITPSMQADLTRLMFFSRFSPATAFGQPTNGSVLISFRRINYVVRG